MISPTPTPALSKHDVHLWQARLNQPAKTRQQLAQTLSPDELERANRLHFETDRRHFIAGRGILRTILGSYLQLSPAAVRFAYGPQGKPALAAAASTLTFNLSHSSGLALYAFALNRAVGVDVERIRPMPDAPQMAARFFSPHENAVFRAFPVAQKDAAFFTCWTRKEAYLKALGDGVTRPLEQFDVSLSPDEPARLLRVAWDAREANRWSMQTLNPAPGYIGALVVAGTGWQLSQFTYR